MGASSSTSASKSLAWYPGEPSADVLAGHDECYYYGDEPSRPSHFKGGGDDTQLSITADEGKRTGGAAPTTTTASTAERESVADRVGVGSSPSDPSSANKVAIDFKADTKRVERDINTLPVVELAGMKVGARSDRILSCQSPI